MKALREDNFESLADISSNVMTVMKGRWVDFQKCFEAPYIFEICFQSQIDYYERNHMQ
jgi:hypothetical protein